MNFLFARRDLASYVKLLAVVIIIKMVDPWINFFEEASPLYLLYYCGQAILGGIMAWMWYVVGRWIWDLLNPAPPPWQTTEGFVMDSVLISLILGLSVFHVLAFILGTVDLLKLEVVLPVMMIILSLANRRFREVEYSKWLSKEFKQHFTSPMAGGVIVILGVWMVIVLTEIALKRGLVPVFLDNDVVGHYLPYFSEVINRHHGFWPTYWFVDHFLARGIGSPWIGMVLGNVFSVQIVHFMIFLVGCGILARMVYRGSGGRLVWSLAAVILACKSILVYHSFVKSHVANATLVFASGYLCVLYLTTDEKKSPPLWWVLLLVTSVGILRMPSMMPIFLMLLLIACVFAMGMRGRWKRIAYLLSVVAVNFVLTLIIYMLNRHQTGMLEFLPSMIDQWLDTENLSQHIDPIALVMQRAVVRESGWISLFNILNARLLYDSWYDMFWYSRSIVWTKRPIIVAVTILAGLVLQLRKRPYLLWQREVYSVSIYYFFPVVLLVAIIFLQSVVQIGAFPRAVSFKIYFSIISLLLSAHAITLFIESSIIHRYIWMPPIAGMFALGFVLIVQPVEPLVVDSMYVDHLLGKTSIKEMLNRTWPIQDEWDAQKYVEPGAGIIHVNFNPGAYFLPGLSYQRPLMNRFLKDAGRVFFSTPGVARATFAQYNVKYAFISLKSPPALLAFSPLFQRSSLASSKIVWSSPQRDAFLLRWDSASGEEMNEKYLDLIYSHLSTRNIHAAVYRAGELYMQKLIGACKQRKMQSTEIPNAHFDFAIDCQSYGSQIFLK